jgi:hypothetical protein
VPGGQHAGALLFVDLIEQRQPFQQLVMFTHDRILTALYRRPGPSVMAVPPTCV